MPAAKRSALSTSHRELSEDVWFGIGTLLVAEQPSLEKSPLAGVIDAVVYARGAVTEGVRTGHPLTEYG